jgi:hypothetical protein
MTRRTTSVLSATLLLSSACGGDRLFLGGGGDSGCVPGTYTGTFVCSPDSSVAGGATGSILLDLEGDRGGRALSIADGAVISGMQAGEAYEATFSGTLDCTDYTLTATLGATTFATAGTKLATVYQAGSLTADYDASDAAPALVNGMISSGLPGVPATSGLALPAGACVWSATLR